MYYLYFGILVFWYFGIFVIIMNVIHIHGHLYSDINDY